MLGCNTEGMLWVSRCRAGAVLCLLDVLDWFGLICATTIGGHLHIIQDDLICVVLTAARPDAPCALPCTPLHSPCATNVQIMWDRMVKKPADQRHFYEVGGFGS